MLHPCTFEGTRRSGVCPGGTSDFSRPLAPRRRAASPGRAVSQGWGPDAGAVRSARTSKVKKNRQRIQITKRNKSRSMPVVLGLLWHSVTVTQLARSVRSPPLFGPPSGCTVGPETEHRARTALHSSTPVLSLRLINHFVFPPRSGSVALRVI